MASTLALTEPVPAPEIFCNGLGRVDAIGGGCAEFVLYRNATDHEGAIQRQIVARIIAPLEAIPDAVALMLAAIGKATVNKVADGLRSALN